MARYFRCDRCEKEMNPDSEGVVGHAEHVFSDAKLPAKVRVVASHDLCVSCLCELIMGQERIEAAKKEKEIRSWERLGK